MNEKAPEFSRIVNIAHLPSCGSEEELEATPTERAALAERFGIVGISSLVANLRLNHQEKHIVKVAGEVSVVVSQRCVVTLEPIEQKLDINIDSVFVPEKQHEENGNTDEISLNGGDETDVETYSGGKIDIGELVSQCVGINIDPYPRKNDVGLVNAKFGIQQEKPNPFEELANMIKTKEK